MLKLKSKQVKKSKPSIGKTSKAKKTSLSEKTKKHHEKLWRLTKSGCI